MTLANTVISCRKVLLEKPIAAHPIKKFPVLRGI
jgi:hypothetical protein